MKRSLFAALPAVLAVMVFAAPSLEAQQARGAAAAQAQQSTRFAYVNSQRLIAEAPGTREAQQTLETEMQRFRTELETLESELETLQANFERQQSTLSPAVRQQRQQEMQQKFMAYQQRRMQLEETVQQRQAELVEPIMKRITDTIEQMRRDGGYAMIFDTSAGALITADPSLDLTDRVLTALRTSAAR
jgi:outer membrane protein